MFLLPPSSKTKVRPYRCMLPAHLLNLFIPCQLFHVILIPLQVVSLVLFNYMYLLCHLCLFKDVIVYFILLCIYVCLIFKLLYFLTSTYMYSLFSLFHFIFSLPRTPPRPAIPNQPNSLHPYPYPSCVFLLILCLYVYFDVLSFSLSLSSLSLSLSLSLSSLSL